MREKLKEESKNQQIILDDVNYRVEWGKYQERIKKQQQEKVEKVSCSSENSYVTTNTYHPLRNDNYVTQYFRNVWLMLKLIGMISSLLKLLISQLMKGVIYRLQ